MNVQVKKEAQAVVVSLTGRLDAVTSAEYERHMNDLTRSGETAFVMDLGGLEYISSAGLRELLVTAKQLKGTGGKIRLANVRGMVKDVFEISGFASIFQMDDSVAGALEHIG